MSLVIEHKNIYRKTVKGGRYFKIMSFHRKIAPKKWKFRRPANIDLIINRSDYENYLSFD